MRVVHGLTELEQLTGTTVGTSGWVRVTQEMVNTFSDVTGDHQWIHLDVERATRELRVASRRSDSSRVSYFITRDQVSD